MAASSCREVVLNIYELTDEKGSGSWMRRVGLGTWHTGVEVGGVEYTFAQNGIFFHVPRMPIVATGQVITLKESMPMGEHVGSANEVHGIINELREEFGPNAYNITNRNCNHFSDALCKTLVGASIPAWVNRPAKIASVFSIGVFGGRNKKEKEGEKEGGGVTKAEKAAAGKRKKLTEEQKARLKAIKGKTTRGT
ncbi:pppde thiol peptidase family protein [Nannochloropsis oceanica]